MNVFFGPNGQEQLPGDLIVRYVQRSDLAPVPRTLELTVQIREDMETRLAEGNSIWAGYENLRYRIVKSERGGSAGLIQGSEPYSVLSVTALLYSCAQIAFRRSRAVIRENQNLAELYRACGADVAIADDFPVRRFSCFAGSVPSFDLARAMQDESAVLVLRDNKLSMQRVANLTKQNPVDEIAQSDDAGKIASEFTERHEIPAFFSIKPDGSFIMGANESTRILRYVPRTDERTLRNMTRVLVTRRVVESELAQAIIAGDVVRVNGEPLVAITTANAFERLDGQMQARTRLWLGEANIP